MTGEAARSGSAGTDGTDGPRDFVKDTFFPARPERGRPASGAPAEFLDPVGDLRSTQAHRHTAFDTPIFTCGLTSARRMLDLADGSP
jgi:hypothetical protein